MTLIFALSVNAECPNGCSGAGTCGPKDKCTCFKNRQGNDCSEYTCPFAYAHADSPKGDLNMDGAVNINNILTDSQVYPMGTRELFPDAVVDEGHFYAECANKGICDRSSGDCECFDGYTGSACQRTVCPGDCNGQGTCESIAELASNAAGTLYGDWVDAGETTYTLWDRKATYGCKCDPWFYGPDCSQKRCKVGVDPMYGIGTPIYDTQVVRLGITDNSATPTVSGTYRLRFYDHWGESFITDTITFDNTADVADATAVATALKKLPNDVISDVTCEYIGALSSTLAHKIGNYADAGGNEAAKVAVACKFIDNPGRLRLMDLVDVIINEGAVKSTTPFSTVSGTGLRGEAGDMAAKLTTSTVTTLANFGTTLTVSAQDATNLPGTALQLAKIYDVYILLATGVTNGNEYTLAYGYPGAAIASGTVSLYASLATVAADTVTIDAWTVGANTFTTSAAPTVAIRGSWIFSHGQFFVVTKVDGTTVTVDRPFNGMAAAPTVSISTAAVDALYVVTPTKARNYYEYVSECSGRGICDSDTGICSCFKGYTKDNCNQQNILAF